MVTLLVACKTAHWYVYYSAFLQLRLSPYCNVNPAEFKGTIFFAHVDQFGAWFTTLWSASSRHVVWLMDNGFLASNLRSHPLQFYQTTFYDIPVLLFKPEPRSELINSMACLYRDFDWTRQIFEYIIVWSSSLWAQAGLKGILWYRTTSPQSKSNFTPDLHLIRVSSAWGQ